MGLNTKEVSRDEHKDIQESFHGELASHPPRNSPIKKRTQDQQDEEMQRKSEPLKCPRCDSTNTKFCYYNNYNKLQPRHFCKACKRHWTRGGILRNVPVGGGIRKNKRLKFSDIVAPNTTATTTTTTTTATTQVVSVVHDKNRTNESSDVNGMTLNEESGNFMASSTVSPMLHNHDLQIWQSGFESFETNQCSNPSFVHSSSFISNIVDEANSPECIDKSITNSSLNEHPWTTLINWDMLNVADFSWDWQDVDRAGASELMIPWDDVDTRLIP